MQRKNAAITKRLKRASDRMFLREPIAYSNEPLVRLDVGALRSRRRLSGESLRLNSSSLIERGFVCKKPEYPFFIHASGDPLTAFPACKRRGIDSNPSSSGLL